ncbi:hypothetical protein KC878_03065 [Candidatus Saccharibacteria bacterium]|nr:hypothetical protein [Candidatus Saccharibacteria bacterium]MCB9821704.1 hypothetical protein [Candidatus Nomurabacteria bacterium]
MINEQYPGERVRTRLIDQFFEAALFREIPGDNGYDLRLLYQTHWQQICLAPGSRAIHQAWPGGYIEHVIQVNRTIALLYAFCEQSGWLATIAEDERFELGDALLIGALHDIEKPFGYHYNFVDGTFKAECWLSTKPGRKRFREQLFANWQFQLDPNQQNALQYAEGLRDADYTPHQRTMKPMAVLVHAADLLSARVGYGFDGVQNG